ncbi:hypothetical protein HPB50_012190 [Hyalomma asiaticum]|uniref:Uncharacterized protein n=1 Tax=Hyalomma asiaticum TaxID=266040 RepID=A0ACB7T1M9_HYAAI|nr:hypothetical protein HPB50_012190 [Hyalomma asiaticum]
MGYIDISKPRILLTMHISFVQLMREAFLQPREYVGHCSPELPEGNGFERPPRMEQPTQCPVRAARTNTTCKEIGRVPAAPNVPSLTHSTVTPLATMETSTCCGKSPEQCVDGWFVAALQRTARILTLLVNEAFQPRVNMAASENASCKPPPC